MSNETMMSLHLIKLGVDCSVDVPAEMFFELLEKAPGLIERIGVEESKKQYLEMLLKVSSEYRNASSFSWATATKEEEVFLRRCQIIVALGAHLHGITLMLSGEDLADCIEAMGGIDVTDQVINGSIPIENFS